MSEDTRQKHSYLGAEWGPCSNRIVHRITQCEDAVGVDLDITGAQLLQLTTTDGCDDLVVNAGTNPILCVKVELDYTHTRDLRTSELVIDLHSAVCRPGWTVEGSVDDIVYTPMSIEVEGNTIFARHQAYDPANCATHYVTYQYFTIHYDYDVQNIAQSLKAVHVTPYNTDCDTGVDVRLEDDFNATGGSSNATNADSGIPTDDMFFLILDEDPLTFTGNGCSVAGLEIMKDDTSAWDPILYYGAMRDVAANWLIVDMQPMDRGGLMNENASAATTGSDVYHFRSNEPLVNVQDGDRLFITGINARIRRAASAGTNQTYTGTTYTSPWSQLSVGDTIAKNEFGDYDYTLYCRVLQTPIWTDDFGSALCGTNQKDSGAYFSGITGRLNQAAADHVIGVRNAHATMTKDLMLDIPVGVAKMEIAEEYTVGDEHIHLVDTTCDLPQRERHSLHGSQFTFPGPGYGVVYVQADYDDGTITPYWFKWTTVDHTNHILGRSDGGVEDDIIWYDDCDYASVGGEPATIPAGMIVLYVDYFTEVSEDGGTTYEKTMSENLPFICQDVAPGDYFPGGTSECSWMVRQNYDGIESFINDVYPPGAIWVEEQEETEPV